MGDCEGQPGGTGNSRRPDGDAITGGSRDRRNVQQIRVRLGTVTCGKSSPSPVEPDYAAAGAEFAIELLVDGHQVIEREALVERWQRQDCRRATALNTVGNAGAILCRAVTDLAGSRGRLSLIASGGATGPYRRGFTFSTSCTMIAWSRSGPTETMSIGMPISFSMRRM